MGSLRLQHPVEVPGTSNAIKRNDLLCHEGVTKFKVDGFYTGDSSGPPPLPPPPPHTHVTGRAHAPVLGVGRGCLFIWGWV